MNLEYVSRLVKELVDPEWRNAARHRYVDVMCEEEGSGCFRIRAYQYDDKGYDMRICVSWGFSAQEVYFLDKSGVVDRLAHAVEGVCGMLDDALNRNDPRVKRLAWHRRRA